MLFFYASTFREIPVFMTKTRGEKKCPANKISIQKRKGNCFENTAEIASGKTLILNAAAGPIK